MTVPLNTVPVVLTAGIAARRLHWQALGGKTMREGFDKQEFITMGCSLSARLAEKKVRKERE